MKNKFIECGKIVSTHGIKGHVRVQPWSDTADFLSSFKKVYLGKEKNEYAVSSASAHKNVTLLKLKKINSIEEAQCLIGNIVYINRDDCNLPDGRYFISDIIGCSVYDSKTNDLLGIISDVTSLNGANDVWTVEFQGKEYLIPVIDDVVCEIDIENEKIIIKKMKGIFDDED